MNWGVGVAIFAAGWLCGWGTLILFAALCPSDEHAYPGGPLLRSEEEDALEGYHT